MPGPSQAAIECYVIFLNRRGPCILSPVCEEDEGLSICAKSVPGGPALCERVL